MMIRVKRQCALGALGVLSLGLAAAGVRATQAPLQVKTQYGWVRGTVTHGVIAF